MKILILGGTGQVGFELQRSLSVLGKISAPVRNELDLGSSIAVEAYLNKFRPDLIVNAAAWTAVDAAEENQQCCKRLNVELPEQLAEYVANNNGKLVHYSSDYVYPGDGTEAWQESSITGPLNVYGQTKLNGDLAIKNSGAKYLIFRTSWVYSARGNNFMKTMLRLAESKTELNVVADQFGAPTPARLIAALTTLAVYKNIESGIYHLCPRGETSWHGFAQAIFTVAKQTGKNLSMGSENVRAIATSDYPTPAKRPLNSRLAITKLEQALEIQLPDWQSQLVVTLKEYLEK
ncbi:dTDP-4-dehydrorhamnose reductase [Pseudomonas mendocina]|nr:dTDP-4-dehydrorhamnose reductase [Pseudomonas mendocina]MDV5860881.1 dTDP-4-dehydrorhamnose reductase [Pseudomonas mendocina]